MSNLIIVESPSKIKTIKKFFPSDYIISACVGHIRDLPRKEFAIDIENNFTPKYVINEEKIKIVNELKRLAKKVTNIYLAPDPDREGEAIAWHLFEILKSQTKANFYRISFNEITKSAVLNAIKQPTTININRVNAQQTRRLLDRIVGYKVSPLLWKRGEGTSAGRVQTVALKIIVDREEEINSFKPEEYWSIKADFNEKNAKKPFLMNLNKKNKKKLKISNEQEAKDIESELKVSSFKVSKRAITERKQNPQAPFITSSLQQVASSQLRISPQQTMRIAQQLYEGINVQGKGELGLISYMRTDSFAISKEAQENAREYIVDKYGNDYLASKKTVFKQKNTNIQAAHEAIRPTNVQNTPESIKSYLDDNQYKLYELIWKRFLASQMSQAKFNQETIEVDSQNTDNIYTFSLTMTKNTFLGHLKVYDYSIREKTPIELPSLKEKDECFLDKVHPKQHFTEPPPRYSEASLIKTLEDNGIGRPSTYASIINTIKFREYVDKEKGKLFPTDLGSKVYHYLIESLPKLFQIKFTASMEENLDNIEQGKQKWTNVLESFYNDFSHWCKEVEIKDSVAKEKVEEIINSFHTEIQWEEVKKIGKRTYDDKKIIQDFKQALDEGKNFSQKQWSYITKIFLHYRKQINNADELIKKYGFVVEQEIKGDIKGKDILIKALEIIQSLDIPVQGKFNIQSFCHSLQQQLEAGKPLTIKQEHTFFDIIKRNSKEIGDTYQELKEKFNLTENNDEINKYIALLSKATTWDEKNTFEKKFFESVKKQFQERNSLSIKQISILKKIYTKYNK